MKKFLRFTGMFILIVVVAGAVLLLTPVGNQPLKRLFPIRDIEIVDFAAIRLTDKPNQFLICPADYCGDKPHAIGPVFEVPVERLRARWREVVAAQPRLELLAVYEDEQQFDYVQRSAAFRFPDIITVRFISPSPSQSTLAIYSRSIYGEDDLGVNRARIEAWLALLRDGS